MKFNAPIIIALGFFILFLTFTGKLDILAAAFRQAFFDVNSGKPVAQSTLPKLPQF